MKLRNRLTLISSITFGIVFTITSILVYFIFYNSSEKIIFSALEKSCLLTGIFYLEEDELSSSEYKIIKQQFQEDTKESEIKIYNEKNQIQYGTISFDPQITIARLNHVRKYKKIQFKSSEHFYYGIFYPDNQGNFVVFIKYNNEFAHSQNNLLLVILISVLFLGLLLLVPLSRLLSNIAYRPITNIIKQVNTIKPESLGNAIISTNTNDEIQDLINTFNNLLKRLSDTFAVQKNFINYISHEFKTPLAAISGSLEVFAQKKRTPEEYQKVVTDSLENVYQIEKILNILMMISGLKTITGENEIFRVDELIWTIIDKIVMIYPSEHNRIRVHIEVKNQDLLTVKGNNMQIQMGLYNLIENAFKYSNDNPVKISLLEKGKQLHICIEDTGRGINPEELKYIRQPFYRGKNVGNIKGNGIGLSLATLLFKQNNITFMMTSQENLGTQIELIF